MMMMMIIMTSSNGNISALLALCAGNSLVTGEFSSQRPVTWSFDVFFDLRLNKWLSKQSWGWWFETTSHPLWHQCNVMMKFDGWPWKTIGHLFYATLSFVHHFIAIDQFKLELQPGNPKLGWKSAIFFTLVTLKFVGWPRKLIGYLSYITSSFVHHFIAISEFKLELQSGNGKVGFWPLWLWPLTSDLELLHGYHFCQW